MMSTRFQSMRLACVLAMLVCSQCSSPAIAPSGNGNATKSDVIGQGQVEATQLAPVEQAVATKRLYWNIYPNPEAPGTYAIMPRADGTEEIQKACADSASADGQFFREQMFCEFAVAGSIAAKRVTQMQLADAKRISAFLHARLKFHAYEGYLSPYLQERDIPPLCALASFDKGNLKAECDWAKQGIRPSIPYNFTPEEADVAAARLNELYGIAR
jgi:hypothetical protein